MQSNKEMVKDINKFLKGVHMGGATFRDYIEKAQDESLKKELKNIMESFKRHEEAITHRVEKLGGNAADTVGIMGMMGEFFEKIKGIAINNDKEVIEHATNAINMGIKQGSKFIEEHSYLEKSIKDEMESIVNDYRIHLDSLEALK